MRHATFINFCIIACVALCLVLLKNPLALFGLMLLQGMPYGLMAEGQPQDDEEEGDYQQNGIGFVTSE